MNKPVCIFRHVEYERLGHLPEVLDELDIPYTSVSLAKGESLPDPLELSGVISMGGPMGVADRFDLDFLQKEIDFYSSLPDTIPVLGICLGAQLLAFANGAQVTPGEWQVGWQQVQRTSTGKACEFFRNLDETEFFQFHQDWIRFEGGLSHRLMQCGTDTWQAFRTTNMQFGVQFHPEANRKMLESVIDEYRDRIDTSILDGMLVDSEARIWRAKGFLLRFLKMLFVEQQFSVSRPSRI